jgi:hypothetical protein
MRDALDNPSLSALYAIVDRRQNGELRVIGEFVDPAAADVAATLLRDAGADVSVVLVSRIDEP